VTADEYQKKAHSFSFYPKPIIHNADGTCDENGTCTVFNEVDYVYPALALSEEAGEVAGKYAKAVRDCNGRIDEKRRIEIKKELGDVMWFVAELSTLLDFTLEEVMAGNIEKLQSRKERGVLGGSGDNR